MKKINFYPSMKAFIILSIVYFLFLLTIIAFNSGNGRYQVFGNQGYLFSTKNGKIYILNNGKIEEKIIP